MQKRGIQLQLRDIDKNPLSEGELDSLIGDRDHRLFLNTRNEIYRARNMKEHLPSRAEAIRMMAREPNLIRRPVVIHGRVIVLGYDEQALRNI